MTLYKCQGVKQFNMFQCENDRLSVFFIGDVRELYFAVYVQSMVAI